MAKLFALVAIGYMALCASAVAAQIDLSHGPDAMAAAAVETAATAAALQAAIAQATAPVTAPKGAPAPVMAAPHWAGKPITRPAGIAPAPTAAGIESAKGEKKLFPVHTLESLEKLSDAELYSIFHQGVADIPSALPNQLGKYTMCAGNSLLNVFTTKGWPNGTLPTGNYNVFNQFFERFWRGKIMHTDPTTNETKLWNLILNNSTVDIIGNVTIEPGLSKDGRDSAIVQYNKSNALFFRPLEDEFRRVGSNIWLGRAWVMNPIEGWSLSNPDPIAKAAQDAVIPLTNATFMAGLAATGLEGPYSGPTSSGGTYATPGEPLALLYFSLDCADFPVPKLHYTPIVAPVSAIVSSVTGYNTPFYSLPDLNKYNNTGDPAAVDNWMKSFPFSTATTSEPYVLWPYTFEEPAGPLSGYLQLPASLFEPVFGAYWAITNQTKPLLQAVEQATAPIPYQNVDNLFPGIDKVVNVNPLAALQGPAEQFVGAADAALAPATGPATTAFSSAANAAVAPIADAIQKGSLQAAGAIAPAVNSVLDSIPNINTVFGPEAPLPAAITGPINNAAKELAAAPSAAALISTPLATAGR